MFFDIKCSNKECDYKSSLMVNNREAFDQKIKDKKCPECSSSLVDDYAANISGITVGKNSPSKISKIDNRMNRASNRRRKKASGDIDPVKVAKNPYYGVD